MVSGKQRLPILNNPAFTPLILALTKEPDNSSGLSKRIGKAQSTIYEQLQTLERENYIVSNSSKKNAYEIDFKKITNECLIRLFKDAGEDLKLIHHILIKANKSTRENLKRKKRLLNIRKELSEKIKRIKKSKKLKDLYSKILKGVLPNFFDSELDLTIEQIAKKIEEYILYNNVKFARKEEKSTYELEESKELLDLIRASRMGLKTDNLIFHGLNSVSDGFVRVNKK